MAMVDPRRRKGARRQRADDSPPVGAAYLTSLALELAPLESLGHWEPVAMRLSEIADGILGVGSVTRREVDELRHWAKCWRDLDQTLRGFYAEHTDHPVASTALYRILAGGDQLEGWQYGQLKRLWMDDFGREPSVLLAPIESRRAR